MTWYIICWMIEAENNSPSEEEYLQMRETNLCWQQIMLHNLHLSLQTSSIACQRLKFLHTRFGLFWVNKRVPRWVPQKKSVLPSQKPHHYKGSYKWLVNCSRAGISKAWVCTRVSSMLHCMQQWSNKHKFLVINDSEVGGFNSQGTKKYRLVILNYVNYITCWEAWGQTYVRASST